MGIVKIPEDEFKIYSRALLVTLTLRDLLYELSDLEKGAASTEAGKKEVLMTNAQKFKEVFGFMPAGCQTFYFVEPNGSYSKTIDWQAPYKEPEHEAM